MGEGSWEKIARDLVGNFKDFFSWANYMEWQTGALPAKISEHFILNISVTG